MTGDKAIGMSAAERDVRDRLKQYDDPRVLDTELLMFPIGVLKALIRDIEMWRSIVADDIDKFSFDALVHLAKLILDTNYPTDIFIPRKVHTLGDDGDLSRVFFITVRDRNDGPVFVSLLREVIKQIEKSP